MTTIILVRFLIVWGTLNLVLLPIEFYRWKRANKACWSWTGYLNYIMWDLTRIVLMIDAVMLLDCIVVPIIYWIIEPMLP